MSDDVIVYHGKCEDVLPGLPDASFDACVTDPPYDLSFMGKSWDATGVAFKPETWALVLRLLKPGGHLLAFGGSRTFHRLACAIEDAGFEIRDTISWLYGSGFPKSLNVGVAIMKAAGFDSIEDEWTPEAEQWRGYGSALKPAWEPIIVARKPLAGTVAANVLAHGTGALNIDGCRIPHANGADLATSKAKNPGRADLVTSDTYGADRPQQSVNDAGRWPANVVLDEDAATQLDQQSGETSYNPAGKFGTQRSDQPGDTSAPFAVRKEGDGIFGYGDRGGASRFYYTAKAAPDERPRVTTTRSSAQIGRRRCKNCGKQAVNVTASAQCQCPEPQWEWAETPSSSGHPTVKPLKLMCWLVRLVTPPGGLVLDPFAGSGTTGEACIVEGFRCVLIEREADYLPLIRARLDKPIQPVLGVAP